MPSLAAEQLVVHYLNRRMREQRLRPEVKAACETLGIGLFDDRLAGLWKSQILYDLAQGLTQTILELKSKYPETEHDISLALVERGLAQWKPSNKPGGFYEVERDAKK